MKLLQVMASTAMLVVIVQAAAAEEIKDTLPQAPEGKTWNLVWHDEFDGTKLDETKWVYPPDGRRQDGYWLKKTVSLDGKGHLVIAAQKDGDRYAGGCIRTRGKFDAHLWVLCGPHPTPEAARPLDSVLAVEHQRQYGKHRPAGH